MEKMRETFRDRRSLPTVKQCRYCGYTTNQPGDLGQHERKHRECLRCGSEYPPGLIGPGYPLCGRCLPIVEAEKRREVEKRKGGWSAGY